MTIGSQTDASQRGQEEGNGAGQEERPPLPPRSSLLQTSLVRPASPTTKRPTLQANATTAVSSVDIQTLSFPDGSRGTFSTSAPQAVSETRSGTSGGRSTPKKLSRSGSEFGGDDSASFMSYGPTLRANGDLASLLDEDPNSKSPAWRLLNSQAETGDPFMSVDYEDVSLVNFGHEFNEIDAVDSQAGNEGQSAIALLGPSSLTQFRRGDSCPVESKVQALSDSVLCWQADLQ